MTPLANVVLKMNQFGSSVPIKFVTPAQLMFLVSDHHVNAGGDPVVKLTILPDDAEVKPLAVAEATLEKLQNGILEIEQADNITEEVRAKREARQRRKIKTAQDEVDRLKNIVALRTLSPAAERRRLAGIYGPGRITKYFPGQIPQFPRDFEEAKQAGIQAEAPSERLLTVGDKA